MDFLHQLSSCSYWLCPRALRWSERMPSHRLRDFRDCAAPSSPHPSFPNCRATYKKQQVPTPTFPAHLGGWLHLIARSQQHFQDSCDLRPVGGFVEVVCALQLSVCLPSSRRISLLPPRGSTSRTGLSRPGEKGIIVSTLKRPLRQLEINPKRLRPSWRDWGVEASTQCCEVRRARARRSQWRSASRGSASLRSFSATTRRWQLNLHGSFGPFSRATASSCSCPTTTFTSLKRTLQPQTHTSPRYPPSTRS
mmetsp:Transcript_2176/g.5122  ORF Transcript_2176/g.5122 Transcript_2176/m.5122 type:complete len:251 (+) Transcript_2176:154-906(+)